ncbi:hypothetical protein LINPERHAP1_LOCUS15371 [Linum perenne]
MGFFAEDSSLIVTHILYKAALVLALLRCALSWALKLWNDTLTPPSSRRHLPSPQQIRERLILTTFGDFADRKQDSDRSDTVAACAVCLNQMKAEYEGKDLDGLDLSRSLRSTGWKNKKTNSIFTLGECCDELDRGEEC